MILPLRLRHRRVFAIMGVLLPIAFVFGIAARRPVPSKEKLPMLVAGSSENFVPAGEELESLFHRPSIRVRPLHQPGSSRRAIRLVATADFAEPDLLVYWVPGSPAVTNQLPATATLLGSFNAPALVLPDAALNTEGSLILFSLADQEVVDNSQPSPFRDLVK